MNAFTPEKRAAFLEVLAGCPNVTAAAQQVGISRVTAYNHRKADSEFAKAWDEAADVGTDALEDEAIRRAHDGVDKPVFHKGAVCGHVREYSDTLMMFTLKARRPEKFRDNANVQLTGANGGPIETKDVSAVEAARRIAFLLAQGLAAQQEG